MNYGKEKYYGYVIQNTKINKIEHKKFWDQFGNSNNYGFNITNIYGCYYGYNKIGEFSNWSLNYVKKHKLMIVHLNKNFIKKIIEIW